MALATPTSSLGVPGSSAGQTTGAPAASRSAVAYPHLKLPDGAWATVYADGLAEVHRGSATEIQHLPLVGSDGITGPVGDATRQLPPVGDIISDLVHGHGAPYAAQQVVVIYRAGITAPPSLTTSAAALRRPGHVTPGYTSDDALNRTIAALGVDRASQLYGGAMHQRLVALHAASEKAQGHSVLDFAHAYVLHLTSASVTTAVDRLRASGKVAYAAPNWTVTTTHTSAVPVTAAQLAQASRLAKAAVSRSGGTDPSAGSGVPSNYALTSSAQALLNRPGVDAVPAYAQIADQTQGQLPGEGETITNVSLGTLTDSSAADDPSDPCNFYATAYGPTTEIINGQRYLDWPSMPLIPTYTADSSGALDPTGETCGDDPTLVEVGLDFSMMAPLPHDAQRPGHEGSGLTDLLGIAPGADYRLVLPSTPGGNVTDVDAAFLGAALQSPRPNIITASLGFGYDQYGFSSRFLEDDPMTEAILSSIVHGFHIVVSVSAGDGLRTYTNAPVSPAGGSVATQKARPGSRITDIADIGFSDAVSRDYDSGSIDVGGSTLDDIFSAPPQDPKNRALKAQHAFPATRYNGARNYSSGFGSRVNVSAPGDNVLSFSHVQGGDAQAVSVIVEGGTSASTPQVAAAAAVVQQVARLTGNQKLATNPLAMRTFLAQTGTPLPQPKQADRVINVGPQIDLGKAVDTLFRAAGDESTPSAPRVAIEQRQQGSALGGSITTATDPNHISLAGRLAYAWITVSPDWVGLPEDGVSYRLAATTGPKQRLATGPWARLQPGQILAAAGLDLDANQTQTVPLVYTASVDGSVVARTRFSLTFGPTDGTTSSVLAPIVPPTVSGATIPVQYDITSLTGAVDPTLVVSQPGHIDPATGLYFRPSFTAPLDDPTGTIDVPVSALQGGGIYGIGIQNAPGGWFSTNDSTYAFTRVVSGDGSQPAPPTLSTSGSAAGHFLEIPYGGSFQLHYDVRSVAGATGAMAEISAPGPTSFNNYATFNNPGGSQRDANGHDTGSVSYFPLNGTHGVATLDGPTVGLVPTMNQLVRVIPIRGGAAAGEASGVSSIQMDGVVPADGGSLVAGFGVSSTLSDGMLTSNQATADGANLGSVEVFDQTTGQITGTPSSGADSYSTVEDGCSGVFTGDVGLYDEYDPNADTDTFHVINPLQGGTATGTWNPPKSLGPVQCAAHNQDSPNAAILSGEGGTQPSLQVSNSNIAKGTFSKPVSLAPGLQGIGLTTFGGFGQDTATGTSVTAANDAFDPSLPMRVVLANAKTGEVSGFDGVTVGFPSGVAVDSSTHTAVIGSYEGFGVYDLTSGTGVLSAPGGSGYAHPGVDDVHHQLLVQEVAPPTFSGEFPDNNVTSSIVITDATGKVLERVSGFNFYNIYLSNAGDYLQANPTSSRAFTLGPGGTQLHPFAY
jgi:hypothetical protein